jgi:FkbM family methyltransferase
MNATIDSMKNSITYIYGTGTFGCQILERCDRLGVKVTGFVDHIQKTNETSLAVLSIDDLPAGENITVILGVCNLFGDLQKISNSIHSRNSSINIISPVQFAKLCFSTGLVLENYWLSGDTDYLTEHNEDIAELKHILSDERSQSLLDQIIKYRIQGLVEDIPKPDDLGDQYLPTDLPTPPNFLKMLELGSFKGEDLKRFLSRSIRIESAFCMEPDIQNYRDLVTQVQELGLANVFPLPIGAWKETSQLKFESNGQSDARVNDLAENSILAVRMDELIGSSVVNYIKMDIEGAEIPAIEGLKNTIFKQNPHLAISVYHKPTDLLAIPLKVNRIAPGAYSFSIRVYGHQTFETVLYCIPKE